MRIMHVVWFRYFFIMLCLSGILLSFAYFISLDYPLLRQKMEGQNYNMENLKYINPENHIAKNFPKPDRLHIPIILYHYVEYVQDKRDSTRRSLDITPDAFEAQIKTLKENGFSFVTPREVSDMLDGKQEVPDKAVILSFDDGYRDFYTDVFPVLEKYHARAVAYLVPGFLNKPNYMFDWQIEKIRDSGLVEIGAHTVHHIALKGLPYSEVNYEILESKRMLESKFGISVVSFAYPYGSFDNQAMAIAKEAGFTTAVTTLGGVEESDQNRYALDRIRSGYMTGDTLISYIERNPYKSIVENYPVQKNKTEREDSIRRTQ